MKRLIIVLSVLLLSSAATLTAQNLKSILKKHYAAVGQPAINAAEAVVINGKINQMGMELPFVIYQKRPGKVKFEATFQDMQLVQAFDGENGWAINPMSGPEPTDMGVTEKKTMQSMAEIEGRLYNWKKKKYKVSYEGDESIEGVKTHKVKVITPDGDSETYYIDSNTSLIAKVDSKSKVQGMDVEATKVYSDYKDSNGYMVAFKTETFMMGQAAGELYIVNFEIKKGAEISDEIFMKPKAE